MKKFNYEPLIEKEEKIMIDFTKLLGVTPTEIIAKDRTMSISVIRHLYCKLRYEMHRVNYATIAKEIGRSPNGVSKGVDRVNDLLFTKETNVESMWNKVKCIPCAHSRLALVSACPSLAVDYSIKLDLHFIGACPDAFRECEYKHLSESIC